MPAPEGNLGRAPHFLGQKYPARGFFAETSVDVGPAAEGTAGCLAILGGKEHAAIGLRRSASGAEFIAIENGVVHPLAPASHAAARLGVEVDSDGACAFRFAEADGPWHDVARAPFRAAEGGWLGARVGLVALAPHPGASAHADFDHLRFSPPGDA
jgi:hypothetical protein